MAIKNQEGNNVIKITIKHIYLFGGKNLLTGNKKYGSDVPQKINKFSLKNESLSYLSQKKRFLAIFLR